MKLAKKTVSGAVWVFLSFWLGRVLTFVSTVILARLLSPADFGLIGMALIVTTYLRITEKGGIGKAVIYKQGRIDQIANTAFFISCLVGFLIFSLVALTSPLVAAFFDTPEVKPLLQFLAISFLLNGVGRIHHALLERELAFGKRLIPNFAQAITKGVVSIILAWLGWGVWSLAWGHVIGNLVSVISAWLIMPWRPSLSFNLKIAKELSSYGTQTTVGHSLLELVMQADYLFVGKLLGEVALGFYTIAFRIPQLVVEGVTMIANRVLFPTYAKFQDDTRTLQRGFLITLRFISLITFPIGIGLFVTAPDLIYVVYTDKWAPAIPVLQVLALFSIASSIGSTPRSMYEAIGRPDIISKITIPRLILLALALWWGINTYGIIGAGLAQLVVVLIITCIELFLVRQVLNIKLPAILAEMKVAFLSTIVMFLSIEFFLYFAPPMSSPVRLIVIPLLGASVYILTIWIIGKETVILARKLFGLAPS